MEQVQIRSHRYHLEHWGQRLSRSWPFWAVFFLLAFGHPLYRSMNRTLPPELPVLFELPAFSFVDQKGNAFASEDLKGQAYIASFAFSTCPTICPSLMEKMSKIQTRVRGVGTHVRLVTFTVDPEVDTAEVLDRYSQKYSANPVIWKFLTGDENDLREVLVDGFHVAMGEKELMSGQVGESQIELLDIAHSEKLALVDQRGRVRKYYSTDRVSVDQLMIDLGLLINRYQGTM